MRSTSQKTGVGEIKFDIGEMAEWSNAAVLKTVDLNGSGGSNPSLSANKLKLSALRWASICLAPPRRVGDEGCDAPSAANPDNIPFFEFQSQADLCGYEWICAERNLAFSCCTGKSSIFTKYSYTQAFVLSKHLQNQGAGENPVYYAFLYYRVR